MNEQPQKCIVIGLSIESDILQWMDNSRGLIKRSTYVNNILKERMKQEND
ncbi:hypothetical protein [Methanolobus sp. WCC5]